jgi:putative salt-induced outer membrane protein YdiY
MIKKVLLILALLFVIFEFGNAQTDSLIFRNGNYIVGEVKKMDRNVVTVETPYSDKDFTIKWNRVQEIYTHTYFLITLSDGRRYNGTIFSNAPGRVSIITDDGDSVGVNHSDIVYLDDLDKGFWSQLSFSIDLGYEMTRSNNFRKFTTSTRLGYTAKRWGIDAYYSTLFSKQDNTDNIDRSEAGINSRYFLPKDWYPLVSIDFLSSTELNLNLRTTAKLGMGKYVVHTNKSYWGFAAGANYNNENYFTDSAATEPIPDRQSMEAFLSTEYNMFNMGDLDLLTGLTAYPSLTESGRWRVDFKIETKYEMWFDDDFYIKLTYSLNYDNQPPEGATDLDYIFTTGFGWSW